MSKNKFTIPVMAFSAGAIVANVYYSQPLLNEISHSLNSHENNVGKISVLAQVGYGLGMFFLLPLGDKVNRKRLILFLSLLLAAVLVAISFTTSLPTLLILCFLTGVLSTPAQIILPMAAALNKEQRGKNVGIVFSGILCGILSSRVIAGWLADLYGWQSVFLFSAGLIIISLYLMSRFLPEIPPKFKGNYLNLLSSTLKLIKKFKTLRQAALLGAFTFGIFCSFWTTLTFHLSGEPFNYSVSTIGMFGLIAIGGALVAPYFGKRADKGNVFNNLYFTVGLIFLSLLALLIFPFSLWVLLLSIFFLDIGVQATQITNFTRIYALDEESHSRLNTIYMTTYFIGAGVGTYFGLLSWSIGGWTVAIIQMLVWSFIAFGIITLSRAHKL
ncbi:Predicted arabinose efflux permease, MFS family [Chryseobacterium arachidis]|uniref:Predicted arabinose efflux permease, MFS family n=1 Tax=Chryseobacterium arachidis TaxID=1416778 RepID=A0A1M4VE53_9FLAO|nr:MFS transporter [Chryseobacterium arachidis]SHE67178.1 Predicted arabinose efflux permease, MFS family [Chryseobacterium arachidis]